MQCAHAFAQPLWLSANDLYLSCDVCSHDCQTCVLVCSQDVRALMTFSTSCLALLPSLLCVQVFAYFWAGATIDDKPHLKGTILL